MIQNRIVILGASGFVARNLKRYFSENHAVQECLTVASSEADLTKLESAAILKKIILPSDTVIVCSAVTPDKGRDVRTQMQNLKMGETLFSFFESAACAHLVYISSDAVYPDGLSFVRENSPCDPSAFYGLTHLVRERMLAEAVKKSKTPFLILRPSALYGAEDTHNSYGPNRFIRTATREGKIQLFGGGEEKRDHVLIDDLCRLVAECVQHRNEGVLNVATGKSVSFFDVASLIVRILGESVVIETSARQQPVTHRHFDVTETARVFPSFRYTPLSEGIAEALGAMAEKK